MFSSPSSQRDTTRTTFLAKVGWGKAAVRVLAADASFRRYYRVERTDGQRAVLMDAPPDKEDVRSFIQVAAHLRQLGLSAPAILARDETEGFLLLEDFGDATFTQLLESGAKMRPLYEQAVDVLIALHSHEKAAEVSVPPYDDQTLLKEAALFTDWYWPERTGKPCPPEVREMWLEAWRMVFRTLPPVPQTLVLRDYHVDNIIRLPDRAGAATCGLLDFQDALIGPMAYDLVSLLEDARLDLPEDLATTMRQRYFAAFPDLDRTAFDVWYRCLGAQRHAKVLGIFTRLHRRDGKSDYLRHIPRVERFFHSHLSHPVLAPVRAWAHSSGDMR